MVTTVKVIDTMLKAETQAGPGRHRSTHAIPTHALKNGRPSSSGVPLAWTHSEYLKLARSIEDAEGQ